MGTKMQLHRYSTYTSNLHPVKYEVDDNFEERYGLIDPVIPTGTTYTVGNTDEVLAVYLNGQRLFRGAGYTETDTEHIQLNLGYELDKANDIIYIEVYDNLYCSHGQSVVSGYRFGKLEKEVRDARTHLEGDKPYTTLDERLDDIQNQLIMALQGGTGSTIDYVYDDDGRIITENITGNVNLRRLFTYYTTENGGLLNGELKEEQVQTLDENDEFVTQFTVVRTYDPVTRRLIQEKRVIST